MIRLSDSSTRNASRSVGRETPNRAISSDSGGKAVSLGDLAADDLAAQVRGNKLRGLRHADELVGAVGRLAQCPTPRADHAAVLTLVSYNGKLFYLLLYAFLKRGQRSRHDYRASGDDYLTRRRVPP